MITEFSPVTASDFLPKQHIQMMRTAYTLLGECLDLTDKEGLSHEDVVAATQTLSQVTVRLGQVSDMPHRSVYLLRMVSFLEEMKQWLITQVKTERIAAVLREKQAPSQFKSVWFHTAPTEDFPSVGGEAS